MNEFEEQGSGLGGSEEPTMDRSPAHGSAPRVTVLMTYYNKGKYVEEAVSSVLASSYTDFELLVVDDASTDGGLALVRAFNDSRIRILESTVNTGRAAAANRGFDAARGEYVAILDADDLMYPGRLAKQTAFLDAHPLVGVLGTHVDIIGADAGTGSWKLTDKECRGAVLFGDPLWYGAAMFRRSILDEHHLRCDPQWLTPGMDYLFLLRIGFHAQYANLPETLCAYRMGEQNMRHGRDPIIDRGTLYREAFRIVGIPAGDDQVRLQLMLHRLFSHAPGACDVHALRKWLDELIAMNRRNGWFPYDVFEETLETRWDGLYHRLCEFGIAQGWAHLSASGAYPMDRLYYLFRQAFDRGVGLAREDPMRGA